MFHICNCISTISTREYGKNGVKKGATHPLERANRKIPSNWILTRSENARHRFEKTIADIRNGGTKAKKNHATCNNGNYIWCAKLSKVIIEEAERTLPKKNEWKTNEKDFVHVERSSRSVFQKEHSYKSYYYNVSNAQTRSTEYITIQHLPAECLLRLSWYLIWIS